VVIRDAIDSGLDAVIVNPTAVLGPGHHQPSMLNDILLRLYDRRLFALVTGGVDCVDVRDVAAGTIAAGQRGRSGHNYALSGTWLSIHDLADLAAEVSGIRMPRLSAPLWLAHASVPVARAWSRVRRVEPLYTHDALRTLRMSSEISHAKATAELGYRPRPPRDTLSDTYAWFRETGLLS
jgi:dihydroflavonol-4-reductase